MRPLIRIQCDDYQVGLAGPQPWPMLSMPGLEEAAETSLFYIKKIDIKNHFTTYYVICRIDLKHKKNKK